MPLQQQRDMPLQMFRFIAAMRLLRFISSMQPPTPKSIGREKGDSNLDGTVDVSDAVCVLTYYAKKASGNTTKLNDSFTDDQETLSYFLSDIDTCSQNQGADGGILGVEDAVQILTHYAKSAAGSTPIWNNRW